MENSRSYEEFEELILNNENPLSEDDMNFLEQKITEIESQIDILQKELLKFGKIKNYNDLKINGFNIDDLLSIVNTFLKRWCKMI